MQVNPLRVRRISSTDYSGGTVIYNISRDLRAIDNDALLFAQELARSKEAKLIVNYVIWNYLWVGATRRFYDWVLPSLVEVEKELRKHNIPLIVTFEDKQLFTRKKILPTQEHVGAVVIDELPLHFMKKWKDEFLSNNNTVPLYEVDAHNCIPVWGLSTKQEFAAHTIRRKIHEKLPFFLEEYGKLVKHTANDNLLEIFPEISWNEVFNLIICDEEVTGVDQYTPGTVAGLKMLKNFFDKKLATYDTDRNNINTNGQSNLSPYIAHGNISRRQIILDLLKHAKVNITEAFDSFHNGSNGKMGSVASFIEECVVRAEISENFCFYNSHYDSFIGFPEWAKATLTKALTDQREFIYTYKEFKDAKTHDDLWNAAQLQMVKTGKMHGYMRMYWAKKILEWSATPQDAMKIAIKLNDIYELDGRDPNGYVGCAWSIGGVHDRPWFGRPIFGAVRYMAESGVKKRGNPHAYIEKWLQGKQDLF